MKDVLDQAVLEELLSLTEEGDPELLLDLIRMFLDDSPSKVSAIEEGLDKGDFEKAERAAHSLKGSSGNLGARTVQDICERLQATTRNHELDRSRRLTPHLAEHYLKAEAALRDLLTIYQD